MPLRYKGTVTILQHTVLRLNFCFMLQRAHVPSSKIKPQFLARELAVLAFNQRVLAQAQDRRVPALERLRFLCILSSNLDEFVEIRVAELKERIRLGNEIENPGETPSAQVFPLVSERAHALVAEQYRLLNKEIFPDLADEGVRFLAEQHWTREQRSWLHHYFLREMIPLLTPIGLDPSHPFPRVLNKSLNFAVQLEGRDAFGRNSGTAIVQAPRALPRVIQLPKAIAGKGHVFVLLTSILQAFVQALFQGMTVRGSYPFRVTRNSDLFLDEEEIKNLRTALAGELSQRHFGDSVRLVVAVKQTVYRTGTDSVLMKYLIDAAQRGKEVTVVVELLARFDEEANLNWAAKLEEVGAHVVYGVVGYKTHAKMSLVVRREDGRLRRYAHVSTGNYHPRTARLYTDFGLLTADEKICEDVNEVFKQLTGLGRARRLHHLWISPFSLHQRVLAAIKREANHPRAGKPGHISAQINALIEPRVIETLYRASQAGVKIDPIARCVCSLRPGIPGLSEYIRVRSVIGRFLEHSRIFYFLNGGQEDLYLSSADWMGRNFFGRIELCFPVLDRRIKERVIQEGLKPYLSDNSQAWEMNSDGNYQRRKSRGPIPRSAQEQLLALLAADK